MLSDFGKCLYITHCPEWDDDQIQYMENYIEFWNEQHDDCETPGDLEWLFEKFAVDVRGEIKAFKMGVLRFNSFGEITVQSRNHLSILGALFINTLGEISIAIRMK